MVEQFLKTNTELMFYTYAQTHHQLKEDIQLDKHNKLQTEETDKA